MCGGWSRWSIWLKCDSGSIGARFIGPIGVIGVMGDKGDMGDMGEPSCGGVWTGEMFW